MGSPLNRPNINYIPQAGAQTVPEIEIIGEEGGAVKASAVVEALESLIMESSAAVKVIEAALSNFAITDKNGLLPQATANVFNTDRIPNSVSYNTYVALGSRPGGDTIRKVFEEKAYSIWGNASIALVDALHSIASEAIRAKNHVENATNSDVIQNVSEWTGCARMFTVDAEKLGTATVDDQIKDEVASYTGDLADLQKSAVIGSTLLQSEMLSSLGRIKNLYSSNIYDSIVDIKPASTTNVGDMLGAIFDRHNEVANSIAVDTNDDLMYRTEAFSEASSALLSSVTQLRLTQLMNEQIIASGGISDEKASGQVSTSEPDEDFDKIVTTEIMNDIVVNEDQTLSMAMILSDVLDAVDPLIPIVEYSWHTKDIHDSLLIDAATLGTKSYQDLVLQFSDISHNHNSAYLGLTATASDSDKLDGVHSSGFILKPLFLANGTDLNAVSTPGMYYAPTNAGVATMSNCPTAMAFSLLVEQHAGKKQTLTAFSPWIHQTWIRNYYDGTWGPWANIQYIEDSGWITTGITNGSGATVDSCAYKKLNGIVYMKITATITNNISMVNPATGDVVDTQIAIVPSGYRPPHYWGLGSGAGAGYINRTSIGTDGSVTLNCVAPYNLSSIAAGTVISVCASYPAA